MSTDTHKHKHRDRPPVVIDLHVEGFGDGRDETFKVNRDEWDAMTPEKRAEMVGEAADEFAANYVAWGWNIADPDDRAAVAVADQDIKATAPNSTAADQVCACGPSGHRAECAYAPEPDHSPGSAYVLPGATCAIPGHCDEATGS
jgi:hypothetical protein